MHNFIPTPINSHSFICDETDQGDCIFGRGTDGSTINNLVTADTDYKYPDFKRYIFSTCTNSVWVVDKNNILSLVREKSILRNSNTLIGNISGYTKDLYYNRKRITLNGVFVIDYYSIFTLRLNNDKRILHNYYRACNIADNPSLPLIHAMNVVSGFDKAKTIPNTIMLRVITYIPEMELDNSLYCYNPSTDLLFVKGDIPDRIIHPKLCKIEDKDTTIGKTIVSFDLVDNASATPYYIKIGSEVKKIYPVHDSTRVSECIINYTIPHNNNTVTERYGINELNMIGLYKTYEEAANDGSIPTTLEVMRMNNEIKKMELSNKRAEFEMQHKETMAMLSIDKIKLETELQVDKHIREMKTMKNKFNLETLHTGFKHILDVEKIEMTQTHEKTKHIMDGGFKLISAIKSVIF